MQNFTRFDGVVVEVSRFKNTTFCCIFGWPERVAGRSGWPRRYGAHAHKLYACKMYAYHLRGQNTKLSLGAILALQHKIEIPNLDSKTINYSTLY
jgi:hypothetical protein